MYYVHWLLVWSDALGSHCHKFCTCIGFCKPGQLAIIRCLQARVRKFQSKSNKNGLMQTLTSIKKSIKMKQPRLHKTKTQAVGAKKKESFAQSYSLQLSSLFLSCFFFSSPLFPCIHTHTSYFIPRLYFLMVQMASGQSFFLA